MEGTVFVVRPIPSLAFLAAATKWEQCASSALGRLVAAWCFAISIFSATAVFAQEDHCRDILLRNESSSLSYHQLRERLTVFAKQDYKESHDKALKAKNEGKALMPMEGMMVPVEWVLSFDKESHDRISYQSQYFSNRDFAASDLLYSSFNGITTEQVEAWRTCMNDNRLASLTYKYPKESQTCDQWQADVSIVLDSHQVSITAGKPAVEFVNCEEVQPSISLDKQLTTILGAGGILNKRIVSTRIRSKADGPAQLVLSFGGVASDVNFVILPPVRLVQYTVDIELSCVNAKGNCDKPGPGHGPVKVQFSGMQIRDGSSTLMVFADSGAPESETSTDKAATLSFPVSVPCLTKQLVIDIPHVTGNCQSLTPEHKGHQHESSALHFVVELGGTAQSALKTFSPAADKPPGSFEVSFKASARRVPAAGAGR